ncbi:hypothetical protein HDV04_004937 [Boothiomyces sp. JEL0838]|nr:hypothetical protein HDV04_004937 [Boothiomyces sp. JEL0838]
MFQISRTAQAQTQSVNQYTTDVYWAVPALQSLISASNKGTQTIYQPLPFTQAAPTWTPPAQTLPVQNAQINTVTQDSLPTVNTSTDPILPTDSSALNSQSTQLTTPIIVAIVIGIIVFLIAAVMLVMFCRRKNMLYEEYSGADHKRLSMSDRLSLMIKPTYDEDPFEIVPLQPIEKDPKIYVLSATRSSSKKSNVQLDEHESSTGSIYGPKKYPNQFDKVYDGRDFDGYMSKYETFKRDTIKNSIQREPRSQLNSDLPERPEISTSSYSPLQPTIKAVPVETVQTITRKQVETKIDIENPFSDEDEFSYIATQRKSDNLYTNYFSDNQSEQQHISQIWSIISRD